MPPDCRAWEPGLLSCCQRRRLPCRRVARCGSPTCCSVYSHSQEDLVEKTNNPIIVTVFGNRQGENCWSGG